MIPRSWAFIVAAGAMAAAADEIPSALPVPRMQVIPLPRHQASITRDGTEISRYLFDPVQERPFCHPLLGPAGRPLTRMGHPGDPVGHSHHNSVWISHDDVAGEQFWRDTSEARIVHDHIVTYDDGDDRCRIVTVNRWLGGDGRPLLRERRGMTAIPSDDGEWMLVIDTQLEPSGAEPVTLGQTAFGLIAVRMAKTVSVTYGGGLIRNSEGDACRRPFPLPGNNPAGPVDAPNATFRRHARWCDYSGAVLTGVNEGITLMDHPRNVNHPTAFHTRADGWMGASLTLDGPLTLEAGRLLKLRYGLWIHRNAPDASAIDAVWRSFAETPVEELPLTR